MSTIMAARTILPSEGGRPKEFATAFWKEKKKRTALHGGPQNGNRFTIFHKQRRFFLAPTLEPDLCYFHSECFASWSAQCSFELVQTVQWAY
jgi:hypothetical protein